MASGKTVILPKAAETMNTSPTMPLDSSLQGIKATLQRTMSKLSATSEDSHSGSYHSDSSTLVYSHESFDQFESRVKSLFELLWTPGKSQSQRLFRDRVGHYFQANKIIRKLVRSWLPKRPSYHIERLRGGGFNRVIGITIEEASTKVERKYILRIPRFEDARPDREVAALRYVQQRTNIPVAQVVAMDFTGNNVLGKPYVIQTRIVGNDIQLMWDGLKHEQRCVVARELGRMVLKIQSLTNPIAGVIDAEMEGLEGRLYPITAPFELKRMEQAEEPAPEEVQYPQDPSTVGFFLHQMGRWRAVDLREIDSDAEDFQIRLWDSLMNSAKEMDAVGLFKADDICLCHLDFQARNFMAEIQSDESLVITGILDWDSAVFAPKFVGCAPPSWLWMDDEGDDKHALYDDDDEAGANDLPSTPEKLELKRIFEETVGPDYLHYAYAPQYPLARAMFRLAKSGIWSNEHIREAERILRDWRAYYQSLNPDTKQ